jgi:pimeloyl-ACP methyl ester carboxylesterase
MWWDAPTDRLVRRLGSFSRLILFDKRGMGLSDRPTDIDVEQWVEDANAVLDAAGSERAAILGISAGAPTAALFAAGHPDRTRALILCGGYARFLIGDDYELGYERDLVEAARRSQELIPGAKLVELDTDIHLIWLSDVIDEVTREIEAFISRAAPSTDADRALATVLAVACAHAMRGRDAAIDTIVERFGGRPLRAPGRATFDGPARAIRCAVALVAELGAKDRNVAVAVHSGECELHQHDVRGVAVDLAEQLAATAEPGQVLVSQTIRDLVVGSTIQLEPCGRRAFRGIPGDWDIFAVLAPDR